MFHITVTDTFGGEMNYAWVLRGTTKAKTRRGLIEAIKRRAGWKGWCRVKVIYWDGSCIEMRPTDSSGVCQAAYALWEE